MARKVDEVVITEEGRDKGKHFVLTEMPASQAEKWAARVFLALTRANVEIPDDVAAAGMAGIAVLGLKMLGGANWHDVEPLMDEMFRCVQYRPDPAKQPNFVRPPMEEDIEEVKTRYKLRLEVLSLHVGFSIADAVSKAAPADPAPSST